MTDLRLEGPETEALMAALATGPTDSFADIGGRALELAQAASARWDCDIHLIDAGPKGDFTEPVAGWVAPYQAALRAAGVDMHRVRLIRRAEDLRPVDMLANLGGFGDSAKIRHLGLILTNCLHAQSRMISDIRKGSGSFPYLNDFGTSEILGRQDQGGVERTRVLFRPKAPVAAPHPAATVQDRADWAGLAQQLAGPLGFYRENAQHSFLYVPRGKTLVVTFDNLDIAMGKRADRRPWGYAFVEKQGWSMLGVMANGWTWYRDPWVWDEFDRLTTEGFFAGFDRVAFYGASMGGYAACAFAAACPGCEVVAISPQSTLDKGLVPWETRYKTAWGFDFSGRYGDAAETSDQASRVSIIYDPYEPLDRAHAERFTAPNVTHLRAPLLGHRLGSSLGQMGILSPVVLAALEGRLDAVAFYRSLRARHLFPRYQRELFQRALDRGRVGLAAKAGDWVLKRGDNRFIRLAMQRLGRDHAGP